MHDHARRLVDNQHIFVFVNDRDRNGLGEHGASGGRRHGNRYAFASTRPVARLFPTSVHGDAAVADQRGGLVARHIQRAGDEYVEARRVAWRGELMGRAGGVAATHPSAHVPVRSSTASRSVFDIAGRAVVGCLSSCQSTQASSSAPMVTAESATLNVQKRTEPTPMSMKSTTPRPWVRKRSMRLPSAPPHASPNASARDRSPGAV